MHDLVIFDCDGVLVDSEVASNQVMVDSLADHGLTLSLLECMSLFMGLTTAACATKAQTLGADLPDGWVDQIDNETEARLRAGVPVIVGIPEFLDRLDALGLPYCVASNGSPDKMWVTLGQNGLWDRFSEVMFSAVALGTGKPDPTLFLTAAQHFGARSPVVIEDSPSGATAAARAGMRCLGFAPHDDGARLAALGAEVFHDMAEVPGLLGI